MKIIFTIVVIASFIFGFSQSEVETINGKKYIVHYAEKKQTLYGIHKKYNVSIKEIEAANNDLTKKGLKAGQKLLIPIGLDDNKHYDKHVIVKNETLYRISKKYKCSVADLKNINPELVNEEIQIGQVIIVPKLDLIKADYSPEQIVSDEPEPAEDLKFKNDIILPNKTDTLVRHIVLAHETLYSIAKRYMVTPDAIRKINSKPLINIKEGDVILVPVKKVNYTISKNNIDSSFTFDPSPFLRGEIIKKSTYKIALLLPLMYDKNKPYMNRSIKVGELEKLHPITAISTDFYHGFLLAADSLSKAGLNVEIYVYDTKKDTSKIKSIFSKNDFTTIDLIIGPFFPQSIKYVAKYCLKNQIHMVLPVNAKNEVLYNNPYVYKTIGSHMTQIDGMIDFLIKDYSNYNMVIVKPSKSKDLALYNRALNRYNSASKKPGVYSNSLVEMSLGSSSGNDMNFKLKKDAVNIVIVPSTDVKFVTSVFTRLNNVLNINTYSRNMKVIVFGLEDWNKISDIDVRHKVRMEQHYASYRFLNSESENANNYYKLFRSEYGCDPKISGVQGFDVGYYFLSALYLYGKNFDSHLDKHDVKLVQNNFKFNSISLSDGKENTSVCIVKYSNYKLQFISW